MRIVLIFNIKKLILSGLWFILKKDFNFFQKAFAAKDPAE